MSFDENRRIAGGVFENSRWVVGESDINIKAVCGTVQAFFFLYLSYQLLLGGLVWGVNKITVFFL